MAISSRILTINAGSSSIKFAVFHAGEKPTRLLGGQVERVGQPDGVLTARETDRDDPHRVPIGTSDHRKAIEKLIDWIEERCGRPQLAVIGHRVVYGGEHVTDHQVITPELIAGLRRAQSLDLTHLPREIALIEALQSRFPDVVHVACFDTVFHRNLPRVAQLLPIPRRYSEAGVRRLGFHGLSYTYLLEELRHAGGAAADGRVILAHLGSGASMAMVHRGRPVDTTMSFTPASGLMMGTRSGDIDPGLLVYLMRLEKLTVEQLDEFVNHRCGLIGVSDSTADIRELIARRSSDSFAADALDLFCYQAKKCIGACAAVLGGVETIVFAGGIGEHSPEVRAGICEGLEFLGIRLEPDLNTTSAPIISAADSRVTVRVIPTDEELMVARIALGVIADPRR
jgi:acetate kinase